MLLMPAGLSSHNGAKESCHSFLGLATYLASTCRAWSFDCRGIDSSMLAIQVACMGSA